MQIRISLCLNGLLHLQTILPADCNQHIFKETASKPICIPLYVLDLTLSDMAPAGFALHGEGGGWGLVSPVIRFYSGGCK